MAIYLETIKTMPNGQTVGELNGYADEMTAAIFYHLNLNTNLRLVQNGELKAFFARTHTESGVKLLEERWAAPEPAPTPEGE